VRAPSYNATLIFCPQAEKLPLCFAGPRLFHLYSVFFLMDLTTQLLTSTRKEHSLRIRLHKKSGRTGTMSRAFAINARQSLKIHIEIGVNKKPAGERSRLRTGSTRKHLKNAKTRRKTFMSCRPQTGHPTRTISSPLLVCGTTTTM
jgi:hypothetical protein